MIPHHHTTPAIDSTPALPGFRRNVKYAHTATAHIKTPDCPNDVKIQGRTNERGEVEYSAIIPFMGREAFLEICHYLDAVLEDAPTVGQTCKVPGDFFRFGLPPIEAVAEAMAAASEGGTVTLGN